ncbi:hypothetical protein H0E87_025212 [Populus deltoides]|uniref:Uncharacterized protein n=1 Tax=Populus deltoides TaxID=3696 RepID=A0A8T2XCN1_POPDE|nr:hypothetical protein H0E87_025212 [Populus deltoides]
MSPCFSRSRTLLLLQGHVTSAWIIWDADICNAGCRGARLGGYNVLPRRRASATGEESNPSYGSRNKGYGKGSRGGSSTLDNGFGTSIIASRVTWAKETRINMMQASQGELATRRRARLMMAYEPNGVGQ